MSGGGVSAALALQEAVFARLSGDATLAGLLGGVAGEQRVHDGAPRNAAIPYVHLGEMAVRDWSTGSDSGAEVRFAVLVRSHGEGRAESLELAERVRALLHDAALNPAGSRLVNLRHLATETDRDGRREGRRATLRFRAVLEG